MDIGKFIRDLRGGSTALEIEDDLVTVARQVSETGKSGTVTLTITIEPAGGNRLTVKDAVSAKIPRLSRETTLFFADEESGELSRTDPRQEHMGELLEIKLR